MEILKMSEIFKALSDPTRLKIIMALMGREMYVSAISKEINLSPSAVSHQLRVLRNMRLVKYHKSGKEVFYSIDDHHVEELIEKTRDHVVHD